MLQAPQIKFREEYGLGACNHPTVHVLSPTAEPRSISFDKVPRKDIASKIESDELNAVSQNRLMLKACVGLLLQVDTTHVL
jgi:hypothetical protein